MVFEMAVAQFLILTADLGQGGCGSFVDRPSLLLGISINLHSAVFQQVLYVRLFLYPVSMTCVFQKNQPSFLKLCVL